MRVTFLLSVSVCALGLSAFGCAKPQQVQPAKEPPIAYDRAAFNPQSEFEMNLGESQGLVSKRSRPEALSAAPRLVSREKE